MLDHFGLTAPVYDRLLGGLDTHRLTRLLQLTPCSRLLDVGGGTGRVSIHLQKKVKELVVTDESFLMLKQAAGKQLNAVNAHAECLPFPDAFFGRIILVDALHHFGDQQEAVLELNRVLAPGGRFVIEEPDVRRFSIKIVALAERLMLMRSRFYTPPEIVEMMHRAGLKARIAETDLIRAWIVGEKLS